MQFCEHKSLKLEFSILAQYVQVGERWQFVKMTQL